MRIFLPSLLVLVQCLISLPIASAALDSDGPDVSLKAAHAEVQDGSGELAAQTWTSFFNPTHIIESIQNAGASFLSAFHLTKTDAPPDSSQPDFWEIAVKYEHTIQEGVSRWLEDAADSFKSTKFVEITSCMNDIVRATATFHNSIQDSLDAEQVTLDMLSLELETIFADIAHDLKKMPPPDQARRQVKREDLVDKILDDTEVGLSNFAARHGINLELVTTFLEVLRPLLHALIALVGDIIEHHGLELLTWIVFTIVALLIPESAILKPLLRLFGFGPAGPGKGSAAAWLQRFFWGGTVEAGSWFSWLQAAGMRNIPK